MPSHRQSGPGQSGFTLIEVMLVCVVVAILAALALPAMDSQLRRSKRSDAITALKRVQQAQDNYLYQNGHYAGELQLLGLTKLSQQAQYTLSIVDLDPNGYTATATAVAGSSQAKDGACASLKLTVSQGGAEYGPNASCWNR